MYHAGRQTNRHVNDGARPVSYSPVPCPWSKEIPRELIAGDIQQLVKDLGAIALSTRKTGFDGVETHAAREYLIHKFSPPNCNHRIDRCDGTYDSRMCFLHKVFNEIKTQTSSDYPVII